MRPVITLKSVVLPAPLGPIRPVISPLGAFIEAPFRARLPPKVTSMSSASSMVAPISAGPGGDNGGIGRRGRVRGRAAGPIEGQDRVHLSEVRGVPGPGHTGELDGLPGRFRPVLVGGLGERSRLPASGGGSTD